ncbi:hypothetical protein GW17_00041010 [Ensete ventricosum]|nr:hypothetical protein GW17_00041010 [Ensete ventricosum]RZS11024.1 hypothetical protein BHM03_00042330 [Ensete ventricosum]
MPPYPPTMLAVLAMRRAFAGGGADLTCVRSAVRPLVPPVYPAGYLRQVGHVGGPAVRGCDDLAARSAFVISSLNVYLGPWLMSRHGLVPPVCASSTTYKSSKEVG